jgi:hypothetical protein
MAKGLSREDTGKALVLVRSLEAQEEAYEFMRPVDFKGLDLLDYPLIVTKPMDLCTVRKKIKAQKYDDLTEAVADLQLIWDNAKLYNPAETTVFFQATCMEVHMMRLCNKLRIVPTPSDSRKRARDDAHQETVSFEEKWELSEQIKKLSHDTLLTMMTVCRESCPKALKELETDKVQITIDELDRATFNIIKDLAYNPEEGAPTKRARR